jgi:hypothetical protein
MEEMVERQKKKVAYFQNTRHMVFKKGNTVKESTPINS